MTQKNCWGDFARKQKQMMKKKNEKLKNEGRDNTAG